MTATRTYIAIAIVAVLLGVAAYLYGLKPAPAVSPVSQSATSAPPQPTVAPFDTSDHLDQAIQDLNAVQ
jgi:hypothetical protein